MVFNSIFNPQFLAKWWPFVVTRWWGQWPWKFHGLRVLCPAEAGSLLSVEGFASGTCTVDAPVSCPASSTSCLFPVLPGPLSPAVAHGRGTDGICRVPEGEREQLFVAGQPGALRDQQLWLLFPRLTLSDWEVLLYNYYSNVMELDFFPALHEVGSYFKWKCFIFKRSLKRGRKKTSSRKNTYMMPSFTKFKSKRKYIYCLEIHTCDKGNQDNYRQNSW